MNDPRGKDFFLPPLSQIIKQNGLLSDQRHSKKLGQNFLLNPSILQHIVEAAGDLTNCCVIEIGPGPGGLTREILKKHPKAFLAIEKDARCMQVIDDLFSLFFQNDLFFQNLDAFSRYKVIQDDALKFDLKKVKESFPDLPVKVISNLPYNVGTKILLNFLNDLSNIQILILMFQKEVAERILAKPQTKAYGSLSVLAQYLANCKKVMTLSPSSFTPPPKVESCLINLIPYPGQEEKKVLLPILLKITQALFQMRRKTAIHGIKYCFSSEIVSLLLSKMPQLETLRPEELTIKHFVQLASWIRQANKPGTKF